MDTERENSGVNFSIPLAIILAGVIIAGAIIYSDRPNLGNKDTVANQPSAQNSRSPEKIKSVGLKDHILGSLNAPVKIVEFSDTECPFCKTFHPTMKKIISDYQGKVAWVYRHFPLDSIHPKARKEAEATECAAELGGEEKFWAYLDRIFEITPSNNGLDPNQLPEIAAYVGLDKDKFEQCLSSGKYAQRVASDLEDAINSGGDGTPYSVVIAPGNKKYVISGAQSYNYVKSIVDIVLGSK
ncbi:MAG: Periplasmic thiol:disulfide interchange protein DsbA [Candidatus Wolfebacteria bacterium GW2011_GWC1_43_10]|uniref:Periplasmic thiol:disulfide interchange protein DsbA n=2 Tax=Candidatus Wolfeibacteriota TaxID=1752735 RepID=A0A0G1C9S4_9BACT|nr:MAG: Periplasmic thiol:disulfide interchange protein DsbA [Candidatus Wolfebacteria bacterium GW2011_GWC1_43_10]OGM89744.1 MAG: hypothetical protein A2108_01375 [Candidatus Wolfebacteria bacterium GWA1_42_9]